MTKEVKIIWWIVIYLFYFLWASWYAKRHSYGKAFVYLLCCTQLPFLIIHIF